MKKSSFFFNNLTLLLSCVALSLLLGCSQKTPPAMNGHLDLSHWDFDKNPQTTLNGEWDFWWNQMLTPTSQAAAGPHGTLPVPGYWNTDSSAHFPSKGGGTYRLVLDLPKGQQNWAIRFPDIASSYRLYVNGNLEWEMGEATLVPAEYRAEVRPKTISFTTSEQHIVLLLQVVNLTDHFGGIRNTVTFGLSKELTKSERTQTIEEAFIAGGLLVMGLFHLAIFFLQRQRKTDLWLALFSFCIAWRGMSTGLRLVQDFLTGMPYEWTSKAEFFTVFGAVTFLSLYFRSLYSDLWSPRVHLPFMFYSLFFFLLGFIFPLDVYSDAFAFYEVPFLGIIGDFLLISLRAILNGKEGAKAIFVGIGLLILGVINDLLYLNDIIKTGFVTEKLLFLFLLLQSFLISRQLARDYRLSQSQSSELRVLDKMKDDFLARVTHELRTPLHGMIGIIEAFRQGELEGLSERQKYHMNLLDSSAKRLLFMVNNILDFSHLKKRQLTLEPKPIFMRETIDFLIPSLSPQMVQGVSLVNHVSPDLPPALGDEIRLQQVLHHLLTNALRHTKEGTVSVEGELNDQTIVIHVKDTGTGIPFELQKDLFGPFSQTMDPDTRTTPGVGLGLAICKELITQMGGKISLSSEAGRGTTVSFSLPICPPVRLQYYKAQRWEREIRLEDDPKDDAPKPPSLTPPISVQTEQPKVMDPLKPVILIVDDEPVNLFVLRTFLTKLDYVVLEATNGAGALETLSNKTIDLVILDVMMPGMSGFEVCRRARERFSPARLPVLLLTAKNALEDLLKGFECGASDFLTKPFNRDELKARLEFHLNLSATVRKGNLTT